MLLLVGRNLYYDRLIAILCRVLVRKVLHAATLNEALSAGPKSFNFLNKRTTFTLVHRVGAVFVYREIYTAVFLVSFTFITGGD